MLFSDTDFFPVALFTAEVAGCFVRWARGVPVVIESTVETSLMFLMLFDILARKWRPFRLS